MGSNPIRVACGNAKISYGILAQLGEHLPYKQRVTGSSPVGSTFEVSRYICERHFMLRTDINGKLVDNEYADMAQLAEQLICNQQVEGSSPPIGFMDH